MSCDTEQDEIEEPPPLNADDYPAVKFWYPKQRTEEKERRQKYDAEHEIQRRRGRSSSNENVRFWFIENEDGTTVQGVTLSKIRADAKMVWEDMCKKYGRMGLPWTNVPHQRRLEFWIKLERLFPLLRLCALHYKANAVATSDYTHWYKNRYPEDLPSSKSGMGITNSSSVSGGQKRRRSIGPAPSRKSTRRQRTNVRVTRLSSDYDDDDKDEQELDDEQLNDEEEQVEQDDDDDDDDEDVNKGKVGGDEEVDHELEGEKGGGNDNVNEAEEPENVANTGTLSATLKNAPTLLVASPDRPKVAYYFYTTSHLVPHLLTVD